LPPRNKQYSYTKKLLSFREQFFDFLRILGKFSCPCHVSGNFLPSKGSLRSSPVRKRRFSPLQKGFFGANVSKSGPRVAFTGDRPSQHNERKIFHVGLTLRPSHLLTRRVVV
jgi:hypothetical protein